MQRAMGLNQLPGKIAHPGEKEPGLDVLACLPH